MEQKDVQSMVSTDQSMAVEPRPLEQISAEINLYKAQTAQNILEIGRRLKEAKTQVPYGEWGNWLRDNVDFSIQTAQRFMKVAESYSNTSTLTHLGYSKLLSLLQVSAEERDEFIAETHEIDGQEKTVADMSIRELERVIKERDEAKRQEERAVQEAELALARVKALEELNEERVNANAKLSKRVKELETRPIEMAVAEPTPDQLAQLEKELDERITKEWSEIVEENMVNRRQLMQQLAEKEETIGQLQAKLQGGTAPEPLPLAVTQGAKNAFQQSVQAAVEQYKAIALCMTVDKVVEDCDTCVDVLRWAQGELCSLQAQANDLQMRDEGLELDDFGF